MVISSRPDIAMTVTLISSPYVKFATMTIVAIDYRENSLFHPPDDFCPLCVAPQIWNFGQPRLAYLGHNHHLLGNASKLGQLMTLKLYYVQEQGCIQIYTLLCCYFLQ